MTKIRAIAVFYNGDEIQDRFACAGDSNSGATLRYTNIIRADIKINGPISLARKRDTIWRGKSENRAIAQSYVPIYLTRGLSPR